MTRAAATTNRITSILENVLDYRVPKRVVRLSRIVVLAVVIAIGLTNVYWSVSDWHLKDMNAYWDAAERLRDGQPLFPSTMGVEASEAYRYSPWFAWLWIPLTYLPRTVVNIGWSAILIVASFAAVQPLMQRRAWLPIAFFLPMLIGISAVGNAHPILIAMLVLGVERRSGPVWIGIAASLKLFPFLLVLTYVGRREWYRAALTAGLTAALVAPFLFYDLTAYRTEAGGAALLWRWPVTYVLVVVVLMATAVRLARSRYGWLVSATTVALSLPRFFVYDATYLLIAVPWKKPRNRQ